MERIKSLDELGISLDDLQEGQRIGITGKVNLGGDELPLLVIGDFHLKAGDHLNLVNYVHKHVDLRISGSESYDAKNVLQTIYDSSKKQLQNSFMISHFKDAQFYMLPKSK